MKRERFYWLRMPEFWIGWILGAWACISVLFFGCTPHAAPIDVRTERVEQRVEDLRFPCDICGQPAKMCEVENWYRCERCSWPKPSKPKKLPAQIVKHPCERCGEPATENVSEVADEFNWRCDRCKPRDVMPRLQRKPKLERQWV